MYSAIKVKGQKLYEIARKGGEVAGIARKALEERTGKPVITAKNATQLNAIVTALIEDAAEKGK